jgi:hypothetical protein
VHLTKRRLRVSKKFSVTLAVVILALMTCAANSVTIRQVATKEFLNSSGGTPMMTIRPYLQNMTSSSVSILWETDVTSTAVVKVTGPGLDESCHTTLSGKLAEVRVEGLAPDTTYTYSVTVDDSGQKGTGAAFKTFPVTARTVKFLVYGDDRSFPGRHLEVVDGMATEKGVDFILSSGDLINDGRLRDNWIGEFFRPAQKLLNHIPYFVALGNHERESELCSQYLRTPGARKWYSFDLPDVHVVVLDSVLSYRPGSDQHSWLVKDLEDHKDAKWKFLLLHHPPYSSGGHGSELGTDGIPSEDNIRMAREVLPGLVTKYGIEASFYGHDHVYERSQKDGAYYIVSGGGGADNNKDGGGQEQPVPAVLLFRPALLCSHH